MVGTLVMRQEAADYLGLHFAKLEDLRLAGHIPEAVRVGRYFCFPLEQLDAIRERLTRQGLIKPRTAAVACAS